MKIDYSGFVDTCLSGKHSVTSSFKYVFPYLSNKKVLDVGCASGNYLSLFRSDSVGIERETKLIEHVRIKGLNVIERDIEDGIPFDDCSFEAVFCGDALEHLPAPIKALAEINRVLTHNGIFVLGLPIENCLIRKLFRLDYFDGTHLYSFSTANAKKLLSLTGFEIADKIYFDIPRCQIKPFSLLLDMFNWLPLPLKELISMHYYIVARKIR